MFGRKAQLHKGGAPSTTGTISFSHASVHKPASDLLPDKAAEKKMRKQELRNQELNNARVKLLKAGMFQNFLVRSIVEYRGDMRELVKDISYFMMETHKKALKHALGKHEYRQVMNCASALLLGIAFRCSATSLVPDKPLLVTGFGKDLRAVTLRVLNEITKHGDEQLAQSALGTLEYLQRTNRLTHKADKALRRMQSGENPHSESASELGSELALLASGSAGDIAAN